MQTYTMTNSFTVPGKNGENILLAYEPATKAVSLLLKLPAQQSSGRRLATATTVADLYTKAGVEALVAAGTITLTTEQAKTLSGLPA